MATETMKEEAALKDFADALEKMTRAGILRWYPPTSADGLDDSQAVQTDLVILLSKPQGKGQLQIINQEAGSVLEIQVSDNFPQLADIANS